MVVYLAESKSCMALRDRTPASLAGEHGRYSHNESYVRSVLAAAGFSAIAAEHQTLRQEIGSDVAGLIVTATA